MDVLKSFLQDFAPRRICAWCLARLTDEPLLTTERRLEAMVRDGSVSKAPARCLSYDEQLPGYRLA